MDFHPIGPLGRFGLVAAMSVCVFVFFYLFICLSPTHGIFFKAITVPQIRFSVRGLSLVNPPSLPYGGGGEVPELPFSSYRFFLVLFSSIFGSF